MILYIYIHIYIYIYIYMGNEQTHDTWHGISDSNIAIKVFTGSSHWFEWIAVGGLNVTDVFKWWLLWLDD